jgi:uncharacterized protein (TIGR03435 family)
MVDRLGLKVHHETTSLPVNNLTIANGGLKPKNMPETHARNPMPETHPSGGLSGHYGNHKFTLSTEGVVPVATLVTILQRKFEV